MGQDHDLQLAVLAGSAWEPSVTSRLLCSNGLPAAPADWLQAPRA